MPLDLRALFIALGVTCTACARQPSAKESSEKLVTDCLCAESFYQWPEPKLRQTTIAAERGDVRAQKDLWDYYLAHEDERNAAIWEERLFNAGEPGAIGYRSDMLFSKAYKLSDTDPMKLTLLKRSLMLEARYRKATAGRVLHVMVNGKYVDIRQTGEPDQGTKRMREILARVQAAQGKL